MIDNTALIDLVENQIKASVQQQVDRQLQGRDLVSELEQDLVTHAKDRITARFANIGSMPDLVAAVQDGVRSLILQGALPDLASYVDHVVLKDLVDRKMESLVESTINNLVIDPDWLEKIEAQINRMFVLKFSEKLSMIDFDSLVGAHIDQGIEKWSSKFTQDFRSTGITDLAIDTELTVMEGGVNVQNTLVARDAVIGSNVDIAGDLTVNNLVLKGSVNVDNRSWDELTEHVAVMANQTLTQQWQEDLKKQIVDLVKQQGINFQDIRIDGQPLIQGTKLNDAIKDTNIQQLGRLRELTVDGSVSLNNTLKVISGRIGVNTDTPDMALAVWDEDVAVSVGKLAKGLAFMGTSRSQNLAIGVNRGRQIEINTDGIVSIKQLRLGNFRIGHESRVPGFSGARGDILFNSDPKPGDPFAWQCLGAFQWQPLRAA